MATQQRHTKNNDKLGIIPFPTKIFIELDQMEMGVFNVDGQNRVNESGTVVAVGKDVKGIKRGDKIFAKAWGLDMCQVDGKDYYVGDIDSKSLLATLTK